MNNKSRALFPHNSILLVQPKIANELGLVPAMFLQQLHYWTHSEDHIGKDIDGKRWIYNSIDSWVKNFLCKSRSTIKRTAKYLIDLGVVLTDNFNDHKYNRTRWYCIDYDRLKEVFPQLFNDLKNGSPGHRFKMSQSSVQNEPIYKGTKITSEMNTGLNCACAHKTSQPMVEECKQPGGAVSTVVESAPADLTTSAPKAHQGDVIEDLESNPVREAEPNAVVVEQEPVSEQTPETKNLSEVIDPEPQTLTEPNLTVDEFVDKAYEIVQEIIGLKLDHPLSINMEIFTRTIKKRMGTHFGLGSLGLSRFSDYCKTFADTPFLMGQKAMSRGNSFVSGIGTILSEKMIERFWDKSKFWQTWPPKKPTPEEIQAAEDARQLEASERQALSLEEALTTAQDSVDKEVKQKLYQALGAVTYKSWIVATGFVARGFENGEPIFDINTAFARNYLFTHHEQQLRSAFACGMGRN